MNLDKHFRTKSKFYDKVHYSKIEREVEDIYNEFLQNYFKDVQIEHPYACDGLITKDNLKLIMEYKYDYDFNSKVSQAKVITQVLFYLKRFENNGDIIPNIILIGDINECFIMHTNEIVKYLDKDLDWKIAPSGAAEKNPDLVLEISNDETINPFVYKIDGNFQFESIIEKINDLSENIKRYVHITEHNISNIYDYFCKNVIIDMKKVSANDIVSVFIGCITNDDAFYMHPSKKGILVTPHGNIRVNDRNFNAFFSHYARKYSPVEKNKFAEISDRLIEDTNRRNKGEFYTPTLFVDYAHKMISDVLGESWRDDFVVFDPAWGTGNLTRDYRFAELYATTLEDAELEIGKKYNTEAVKAQFDFLNDPLEKLPVGLLEAFKTNRKILFLLNPPYGKATGAGGNLDAGSSDSIVKQQMQKENIEGSEFIKQFLWRIVDIKRTFNLSNLYIACFTKPTWLIKPQSYNFRKLFLNNFEYQDGVMFCASEFANVSSLWGITFNIWKSGKQKEKNEFNHKLIRNTNGNIEVFDNKLIYNFDDLDIITTSEYITKKLGKKHKENIIYCKDIKTMAFDIISANVFDNYIGTILCAGNDVQQNGLTCIRNAFKTTGGYLQLTKDNIFEATIILSIKGIIQTNWVIDKDMYNMNVEIPDEFKYDCFVNALFGNYCCGIKLENGKILKNELFWYDMNKIKDLANEYNLDYTYQYALTENQRYAYTLIHQYKDKFSDEANALLNKANEMIEKSFKYRELFNDEHPEVQILNPDSGWYQLKQLYIEYLKDDYNEFKTLQKALAEKLKPQIYTLGFLK